MEKRRRDKGDGTLWNGSTLFLSRSRPAFGLWQAIVIILLVTGIMMLAMKYARVGAVHTIDSYTREQAELFMRSALEIAILQIEGHDRSSGCLQHVRIVSKDRKFIADVNITHYYLVEGSSDASKCGSLTVPIHTEDSHGMVMIEAMVESNTSHPKIVHPVRLLRRTLQHP